MVLFFPPFILIRVVEDKKKLKNFSSRSKFKQVELLMKGMLLQEQRLLIHSFANNNSVRQVVFSPFYREFGWENLNNLFKITQCTRWNSKIQIQICLRKPLSSTSMIFKTSCASEHLGAHSKQIPRWPLGIRMFVNTLCKCDVAQDPYLRTRAHQL